MDILTSQERSLRMSRIRGTNTRPEMVVRRILTAMGYRYRLHRRDLPGTPDLVFPSRRKAVFIHGCFWHRHTCRQGRSSPSTRREFWTAKFDANVARDQRTKRRLRRQGWKVLVVWECETRGGHTRIAAKLRKFLEG